MTAENNNNANNARKVLGDFTAPTPNFFGRSISIPAIGANNFELKPQLVSLMQQNCKFHGLPLELISSWLNFCKSVTLLRPMELIPRSTDLCYSLLL